MLYSLWGGQRHGSLSGTVRSADRRCGRPGVAAGHLAGVQPLHRRDQTLFGGGDRAAIGASSLTILAITSSFWSVVAGVVLAWFLQQDEEENSEDFADKE